MRIVELILQRIFAVSEKLERVKPSILKIHQNVHCEEKFTKNVHCEEKFTKNVHCEQRFT